MGLESAGKPEIAQQDADGDSADHLESGLMPGLNTDHFHTAARELLFQHNSHGVPVAFQSHNDVAAVGLPQINIFNSSNQTELHTGVKNNLAPYDNKTVPLHDAPPAPADGKQPSYQNGEIKVENYVVKKGDSLWKIARENLPKGASNRIVANYVHQIEADNPMHDPNLIMPGQIIKLRSYTLPAEHDTVHGASEHRGTPEHYRNHQHREHHSDYGGKIYSYPYSRGDNNQHDSGNRQHDNNDNDHQPPLPDTIHHKVTPLPDITYHKDSPQHDDTKDTPLPAPQPRDDAQPLPSQHDKPQDKLPPVKDQPPNDSSQDAHPVTAELHRLITLAQQKVHNQRALTDIETNARQLAETEGEKARLYMIKDKLSYSTARDNARAEIVETYKQAQRLLLADKPTRLSHDQLHIVAAEILHHAANPDHIDQGLHNTCQTTALESMMYKLHPSKAAKLVADTALTGKFTSPYDGTTVEVDPRPQDEEAKWYPTKNGERSLASQIFQETAINLAWAKKDSTGKTHYEEVPISAKTGTAIETLVQEPGSSVPIDPALIHSPYLSAEDVAYMRTAITGKPEEAIVVERGFTCDPETVCVSSAEDLGNKLEQRKETGKLPIIVYVDTSIDGPLKTPEGGIHAILATGITGGKIRYYNWWGEGSTDQEISLNTLYGSMRKQSQNKARTGS